MAQSIDILLDTDQPIADLAPALNKLLDIDLQPAETNGKAYYAFRALTLTLDLYPFEPAQHKAKAEQNYRYHIAVNGIFGSEQQRTKWTEDWAFGIMQKLKTQNYRFKRVDNL